MKMFTNATVSSMSENKSAFNMAANMMKDSQGPSRNMGPPPAPVEIQNMPPPQRPGSMGNMNFTETLSNRPDISWDVEPCLEKKVLIFLINMKIQTKDLKMKGPQNSDIDNRLAGLNLISTTSSRNSITKYCCY